MPEIDPAVESEVVDEGAKPDDDLGEKGVEALRKEREARKAAEKALNDLAAKVKAFEDRDKTESEKLQEQLSELTSRASKAERENARLAVIAEYGIPKDYQDLIQGDDAESMTAVAAKVQALVAATSTPNDRASLVIPSEGGSPAHALNSDGLESALKSVLGIN